MTTKMMKNDMLLAF